MRTQTTRQFGIDVCVCVVRRQYFFSYMNCVLQFTVRLLGHVCVNYAHMR